MNHSYQLPQVPIDDPVSPLEISGIEPSSATRHPYRFTALLVLAILTAYLAAGTAASILELDTGGTAPVYFTANLALTVLVIALLTRMRWWKHVGFRALASLIDLRLYWMPFTLVLVNVSFGIAEMSFGRIAYFFLLAGMIGFIEESVFRGLILRAIAPRGLWKAAIVSSILFGLLHSLNVFSGANPLATLLQIGYALAIGFGFAALALRTQVIWPLVIIHALMDFTGFLAFDGANSGDATTTDLIITALYIVAVTGYGIYMMRGAGQDRPLNEAAS